MSRYCGRGYQLHQIGDRNLSCIVTGDTLSYRVNKDKFITNGFMSWYALDRLKQPDGNLSYKRLFIQDINSELTAPVVLNSEKGKVRISRVQSCLYRRRIRKVKMFEQKTGNSWKLEPPQAA